MVDLVESAWALAIGSVLTLLASFIYPTRSQVRQGVYLFSYVLIAASCAFFLLEHYGVTTVLAAETRGYIMIAVLGFIGTGIITLTLDLYVNFEALKDDRAYALSGKSGLALSILILAPVSLTAISMAWYQVDPTIFEPRSNLLFLVASVTDGHLDINDYFLFALDQTQKALLFDISEVYRIGLIDIGNNPQHYAFSTVCLIYRTFLLVFVVVIVLRLLR